MAGQGTHLVEGMASDIAPPTFCSGRSEAVEVCVPCLPLGISFKRRIVCLSPFWSSYNCFLHVFPGIRKTRERERERERERGGGGGDF